MRFRSPTDVTVVVPAHNEAEHIEQCLRAIDAAAQAVAPVPVRLVVVLDDCSDSTASVVGALELTGVRAELRAVRLRRVGSVRASGFAGAPRSERSWYCTTDADSVVPEDWLLTQLRLSRDHDVFVGTVRVTDWSLRFASLAAVYEERYRSIGTHRHVHATNLGIRAETYWRAGGFADESVHEDRSLVLRCEATGARVAWSAAATVTTSARHSDRTPWGFSAYLTDLESDLPA